MGSENIIFKECRSRSNEIDLKKFKNKSVCILGGNSFLASYIISILSEENISSNLNCKINLYSRNKPSYLVAKLLKRDPKIKFSKFNFHPKSKYKEFFLKKKYDYIFYCLTYGQPAKWLDEELITIWLNTELLKFFLQKSVKDKSILMFFSSVDVYGDTSFYKSSVKEDYNGSVHLFSKRVSYGESKRLGEVLCKVYRENYNLKSYVVRPAHTYGPGMSKGDRRVIVELIQRGLKEKKITLLDKGLSKKTYGYIYDIAKMFILIIQYGNDHTYNTTGKDYISIMDLAKKISNTLTLGSVNVSQSTLSHIQNDKSTSYISSNKAYREFKIKKLSSMQYGINNLIKWLKLQNDLK